MSSFTDQENDTEMFETPSSTADFDFASLNPASLKARFRSAFKGLKSNSSSSIKTSDPEFSSDYVPVHKSSDVTTTFTRPSPESSSRSTAPRKTPKDVEVALQFFNEVLRTDKTEMLVGSVSEIFDAVVSFMGTLKYRPAAVEDALFAFLEWCVDKLQNEDLKICVDEKSQGKNLASMLAKRIQDHDDTEDPSRLGEHAGCCSQSSQRTSPMASTDSGFSTDFSGESSTPKNRISTISASTSRAVENQQTIDDLLAQLNLRRIEKFEPVFPTVINDDSDEDDSSLTVDEQREEREEKKDTKTCEEEIQRLADGRELHTKKTRTYNMKQSSKHVTIRTHGGGQDDKVQKFEDHDMDFNDDVDTEFFSPRTRLWGRNQKGFDEESFDEKPKASFETPPDNATSQKLRTVEHSNAVTQSVAKTEKRNGKVVSNNAAHKLDTCELKAKQIENYQGDKLLNRRGDGFYEEQSIVRPGLPSTPAPSIGDPVLPKRRHVVEYMQTFGSENEEREDFFKGSTLASYILLNDNLRYHEEQYKKNVQFKFSVTGPPATPSEFSSLGQLLQSTDFDQIRLPKKFLIEDEVCDPKKEITYVNRLSIAGVPSVLESTDVRDWLVLRVKDGSTSNEVRGGPADALIAFAAQPAGSLLYQEAFLTTYRTFVPSFDLIQKLIKRYLYMSLSEDPGAIKVARQCFSVLVRVVDDLCCIELSKELISTVNKFTCRLIHDRSYTFAKLLRKRLMTRFEQKANVRKPLIYDVPPSSKNKQLSLFEFRSGAIAKQMTLLDADLFQKIEPAEMLWWAQEQDEKKSPNLCAFTEHFNKVSYWVRTVVIRPKEQRLRDKYLMKFIKIMKQLRSMGNYNSYLAVLSALESGPIRRLDWPKNYVDIMKEHAGVMDSTFSFKNYRTLLTESRPPCLPYLGLVLQDLTFVHIGNSDCLSPKQCQGKKNLLNFGKRWQQFTILDSIRRFKSWNYSIERDDKLLQVFGGFKDYLSEDDIWELSETIKPRSRKNK